MIDGVARRSSVLPTELLAHGSSFDITVAETAQRYENYLNKTAEARAKGVAPPAPVLSEKQMLAMVEKARKLKDDNKSKGRSNKG